VLAELVAFQPDLFCVVAFGQILKPDTLAVPRLGAVNLHFSLLPRWRGAAPVEHAIWSGDTTTGLTTQHMAIGLDEGDIILRREAEIGADESAGELLARLSTLGAEVLSETVRLFGEGSAPRTPQDPTHVTWAPRLQPEQGALDLTRTAAEVGNHIRAFNPRPGCFTRFYGEMVKVWRARVGDGSGDPGEVLGVGEAGLEIGTGAGSLLLAEVQPAGRGRQTGRDFANGRRIRAGARFDPLPPGGGTR
jgi:methionyl-tRNA formyltransferase